MAGLAKDYSPFTPGQPVPIEYFVGRMGEIERLQAKVRAAANGRLQIGFLAGERGIGKSSLASFVGYLAERDGGFLTVHTFLGGVGTLEEMVRRTFDRILKASLGQAWYQKVSRFFGNHVREVGLFGVSVELGISTQDLTRAVHDFGPAVKKLLQDLRGDKAGILLVLDDINGLAASVDFANWLKSLVDEIATSREPLPLFILMVGLEERRQSLLNLQPSLNRVFDVIDLPPWSTAETTDFYRKAFENVGVTIDGDALGLLALFAGGLPVIAHEIGDAVFKVDSDGHITKDDVIEGVIAAADVIGRKQLQPQVYSALRSPRYRTILRRIAMLGTWSFKRSEILPMLSAEEVQVFDNFLRRMTKLGVFVPDTELAKGAYRFANLIHAVYFRIEAGRERNQPELPQPQIPNGLTPR